MALILGLLGLTLAAPSPPIEPDHDGNPVYSALGLEGWKVGGKKVAFPSPTLGDSASADEERAALRGIAGSDRSAAEFTRDSVSAPFLLKTRDEALDGGDLVRTAALWFVVRGDLDAIDPDKAASEADKGKPAEAGNMRFTARRLGGEELGRFQIKTDRAGAAREWYVHLSARLLDRIGVEATDRVTATRTAASWVIASRTDARFDDDRTFPNLWRPIKVTASKDQPGEPKPYAGGASYVKITRLATVPGALLVEAHLAFDEPKAWFDGAPILRSKLSLVAQDRIRALRRDLAKSRTGGGVRNPSDGRGR